MRKPLKNMQDWDVRAKVVLVRCDFNVPLQGEEVRDDTRIRASLETIQHLIRKKARVVLISHLGRPSVAKEPQFTLRPVAKKLEILLKQRVFFVEDCLGALVESTIKGLQEGQVLLLENVRYYPQEMANEEVFAQKLAALGDYYINDAFGSVHRAHASTEGIAHWLPAAAGFLVLREDAFLHKVLSNQLRPAVAIVGGAKVSSKIMVLESLLPRVSCLIIGGAMAYTFLHAQGYDIGASLLEEAYVELAKNLLEKANQKGVQVLLPIDHKVTEDVSGASAIITTSSPAIAFPYKGVDVGPRTLEQYVTPLAEAKLIVWNGPLGIFEVEAFSQGTLELARLIAKSTALKIVGGGDSVAAVNQFRLAEFMDHISTGGGASLEYLEGKALPGLEVLRVS